MGLFGYFQNIFSWSSRNRILSGKTAWLSEFILEKERVETASRIGSDEFATTGLLKDALQLCDGTIQYLQGKMSINDWKREKVLGPITSSIMNHDKYKRGDIHGDAKTLWGYAYDYAIPEELLFRKTLELSKSIRRVESAYEYNNKEVA